MVFGVAIATPMPRSPRSVARYYICMGRQAHAAAHSSPTPHIHADIRTPTCAARQELSNGPRYAGERRSARAQGRLQCRRQRKRCQRQPESGTGRATTRRRRLLLDGPSTTIDPAVSGLRDGLSAGGAGSSGAVRLQRSQRCSARAGKRHRQVARRAGLAGS